MLGDIDPDKPERFEKQIDFLRRLGVKEFTDAAGRKVVIDLQHRAAQPSQQGGKK